MVGIAVVLIGVILGTIVVQSTLAPLKRIEKTAAKIAAGDLSPARSRLAGEHGSRFAVHVVERHADAH